ncbi:MAG: hypothetical protein KKA79_01895 [Nanoarchaeota archaeon]|nr:hypothetical protein [Nanoarchaeota archaeon]
MKKIIITLLIIILFLFLFQGIDVFAASCAGTCDACSTFSNSASCGGQDGCSWQGPPIKACTGTCDICTTYSDQTNCNDQGGCSWTAVCGDGTCDSSEDCSCSDCEGEQGPCQVNYYCSGGSCVYSGAGGTCAEAGGTCYSSPCGTFLSCYSETGGSCTTGYCCTGACTTEVRACGDGECDAGETCLNCESDCGACVEEAVSINLREPPNRDTLKRGTHVLKVIVFFGKRPTSSAKVYAEAPFFPEKLRLYDDSVHQDEKQFDGIYANEFIIGKDVKPGDYKIKLTAEKDKARDEEIITLTVDPNLNIKLASLQESYVKGERINLNGEIEDFEKETPNVTVKLSLDRLGDMLYEQTYKTNVFGQFLDSYLISFADPDGGWNLKITAEDKDGNEGKLNLKPMIGTPAGVTYYLVEFLSPVKGASYSRGETVPISIQVSQEEMPIERAKVTLLSPKGKYLELTELEPGVYTTNYNIDFNDPLGQWRLAVQAIKEIAGVTRAGGNTIPLQIKSGEIRFEILSPIDQTALTGQNIIYRIKAMYPDDTLVRGAELKVELSNNQTLIFFEEKAGIYTTEYLATTQDIGALDAKIIATDTKGNTAIIPSLLLHVEKRTIVELYMILFYRKVIRLYWWAFLTFLIIAGMLYKPTFDIKMLNRILMKSKNEQKTVRAMQIEAEREYYKLRSISKSDFKRLIQGYKERLANAKEQQKKAEEKLGKKLKKVKKK